MRALLALLLCLALPALGQVTTNSGVSGIGVSASALPLTGTTAAIAPGALLAGVCGSGTVSVSGSTTGMTVSVSANTYPGDGSTYYAYVSSAGTVTVKVCAIVGLTPTSSTYNVRVIQ